MSFVMFYTDALVFLNWRFNESTNGDYVAVPVGADSTNLLILIMRILLDRRGCINYA